MRVLKELEVSGRDRSLLHQYIQVDYRFPVGRTVENDRDLLGQLFGLGEGKDFEGFVERAKAAGKDHQRLGKVGEPVLAHEEVVELEVERRRDVGVGQLLKWQLDVKPNGLAAGFVCAAVRGLHNSRPTTGGDNEAALAALQGHRPLGEDV